MICAVYNGVWGKAPYRSWGVFEDFCDKSKLTVCTVTFDCKLQTLGEQDVLVVPPIIISLGKLPRFPRLSMYSTIIEHVHEFHRYKVQR